MNFSRPASLWGIFLEIVTLLLDDLQEKVGKVFVVFSGVSYVGKYLCQSFLLVFGHKSLVGRQSFFLPVEAVDVVVGVIVICFVVYHGLDGQALNLFGNRFGIAYRDGGYRYDNRRQIQCLL